MIMITDSMFIFSGFPQKHIIKSIFCQSYQHTCWAIQAYIQGGFLHCTPRPQYDDSSLSPSLQLHAPASLQSCFFTLWLLPLHRLQKYSEINVASTSMHLHLINLKKRFDFGKVSKKRKKRELAVHFGGLGFFFFFPKQGRGSLFFYIFVVVSFKHFFKNWIFFIFQLL